ncbi:MAG: hypothetical protein A3I78_01590 [Gammaproteobacteria bacterium RIFCSPLOWO2_02_FULL_56_15]|nr:MAG: hypothetical protein A3I78_01590 [Gammaproteobacteria bacterium RIFCSPLOWO2_02_FULL_56_15]
MSRQIFAAVGQIRRLALAWLRDNERSHLERPPLFQSWIDAAYRQCFEHQRDKRFAQRRRRSWQQIERSLIEN